MYAVQEEHVPSVGLDTWQSREVRPVRPRYLKEEEEEEEEEEFFAHALGRRCLRAAARARAARVPRARASAALAQPLHVHGGSAAYTM